jgi:hypothetical protein
MIVAQIPHLYPAAVFENQEARISGEPSRLEAGRANRRHRNGILKSLRMRESTGTMIRETTVSKPYSRDLRERVVRAVEAGASCP